MGSIVPTDKEMRVALLFAFQVVPSAVGDVDVWLREGGYGDDWQKHGCSSILTGGEGWCFLGMREPVQLRREPLGTYCESQGFLPRKERKITLRG